MEEQIRQLVDILERELRVPDPLTGLYGPRYLTARMKEEIDRSDRFGQHVPLIMVRVQSEDPAVLRTVGQLMRKACRSYDIPARLSEQEMAILLPGTEPEDAVRWGERFLEGAKTLAPLELGISHYPGEAGDAAALLEAAKKNLQ